MSWQWILVSHETIKFSEVTTINKIKVPFSEVDLNDALCYAKPKTQI